MINALPTIHEVVAGVPKTQQKEESTVSNQSKNKSKPNANKVKNYVLCCMLLD